MTTSTASSSRLYPPIAAARLRCRSKPLLPQGSSRDGTIGTWAADGESRRRGGSMASSAVTPQFARTRVGAEHLRRSMEATLAHFPTLSVVVEKVSAEAAAQEDNATSPGRRSTRFIWSLSRSRRWVVIPRLLRVLRHAPAATADGAPARTPRGRRAPPGRLPRSLICRSAGSAPSCTPGASPRSTANAARPRPPERETGGRHGPQQERGPSTPTAHSRQFRG